LTKFYKKVGVQMNILNIVPNKDKRRDCADDIVATISSWLGRDYELMYAGAMNFSYQEHHSGSIGDRIVVHSNKLECLSEYHGIKAEVRHISAAETLRIIESELADERPVGLSIDSYYCPWDLNFNKEHFIHHILVVGYKDELIITDPYYLKMNEMLPLDCFFSGCNQYCATYSFSEDIVDNVERTIQIIHHYLDNYVESSPFIGMKKLAEAIYHSFDFETELDGRMNVWETPIFINLSKIIDSKKEYSLLMFHMHQKNGLESFEKFGSDIYKIGMMWENIRGTLVKMLFKDEQKYKSEYVSKIAKSIVEAADQEEEIVRHLMALLINGTNDLKISGLQLQDTDQHRMTKRSYSVDLSSYFNEKAFGTTETPVDFCDNKFCIVNEFPERITIHDRFHLQLNKDTYDIVNCRGQMIDIQENDYLGVTVIGFSDWGNHFDELLLNDQYENKHKIIMELSDWWGDPVFGESVVCTLPIAEMVNHTVNVHSHEINLFSKTYYFNDTKLTNIKLPFAPNMHIFGIIMHM
jgi:hypothetical protein